MKTFHQMVSSVLFFLKLVFSGSLHLRKNNLGKKYSAPDGKTYQVFLNTVSDKEYSEQEVTLIVGFRLFLIGNSRFFHWLFQHLCMLDTPVWVGLRGFKEKFWMVDQDSKNYLGIYHFRGKEDAKVYANYICAVLRPVSTKNSVWYKIVEENFDSYTKRHRV